MDETGIAGICEKAKEAAEKLNRASEQYALDLISEAMKICNTYGDMDDIADRIWCWARAGNDEALKGIIAAAKKALKEKERAIPLAERALSNQTCSMETMDDV